MRKNGSFLASMASASFYTGRGPILVTVIWTWAGIATVLYVIRAIKASIAPKAVHSFFGLRWDFLWVTVAYVGLSGRFSLRALV